MNHCLLFFSVLALSICTAHAQSKKSDKEPERLTTLRQSWQQARDKATEPIDLKYRQELQKILDSLTKAGDLDGALVVKQELEVLGSDKATEGGIDTGRSLLTRLRGTTWTFDEGNGGESQIAFAGKEIMWTDTAGKTYPMKIEQMKDGALLIPWGKDKNSDRRIEVAADHSSMTIAHAVTPDKKATATLVTKKKP